MTDNHEKNWLSATVTRLIGDRIGRSKNGREIDSPTPENEAIAAESTESETPTNVNTSSIVPTAATLTRPDWRDRGYDVVESLGTNYLGGRATYRATQLKTQKTVVIKQFQFARPGADWSAYKAHEREIQVLRGLNHPGIPQYLDSFETPDGFCLVHEYKNAESLANPRTFTPEEIKTIAVSILEILVYLQNRIPPVIHRDLKPENILVDDNTNVYLIDFGFARMGGEAIALSSVVSGTTGFMPPEQLLNLQLSEASDLYSLGVTLTCLLTGTKSSAINNLIDSTYRVNFRHLLTQVSDEFIEWLEKMVQPNAGDRFANATEALKALKPLPIRRRLPQVELSASRLDFTAEPNKVVSQTVTVKNTDPKTLLEARWEIATDPENDAESCNWIYIEPAQLSGNETECRISVDTHQLSVNETYGHTLILHANSIPDTYSIPLQLEVRPPCVRVPKLGRWLSRDRLQTSRAIVFSMGAITPLTLVWPGLAIALSVPLTLVVAQDLSETLTNEDLDPIAKTINRWMVAPGLAVICLWGLTQIDFQTVENSTLRTIAMGLTIAAMGGVSFGVLKLFSIAFKRVLAIAPILIFGTSFVLVGLTTGFVGTLAEAGIATLVLSSHVRREIRADKLSRNFALKNWAVAATVGAGIGGAIAGLLFNFGIVMPLW
jgi:serine/threonine protein kinase/uncharacterized integral membrane protein